MTDIAFEKSVVVVMRIHLHVEHRQRHILEIVRRVDYIVMADLKTEKRQRGTQMQKYGAYHSRWR